MAYLLTRHIRSSRERFGEFTDPARARADDLRMAEGANVPLPLVILVYLTLVAVIVVIVRLIRSGRVPGVPGDAKESRGSRS